MIAVPRAFPRARLEGGALLIAVLKCSSTFETERHKKRAALLEQNHICPNNIIVAAVRALLLARLALLIRSRTKHDNRSLSRRVSAKGLQFECPRNPVGSTRQETSD